MTGDESLMHHYDPERKTINGILPEGITSLSWLRQIFISSRNLRNTLVENIFLLTMMSWLL